MHSPTAPCLDCLSSKDCTLESACGRWIITHCEHNQAGAIYTKSVGMWRVYCPIDSVTFAKCVRETEEIKASIDEFERALMH